jgi:hypothetical protein
MAASVLLKKADIGSVFVINFSLRDGEDGTKTLVKQTKVEVREFPSVATELGCKEAVMRWVSGGDRGEDGGGDRGGWGGEMKAILVQHFQPGLGERNCFKKSHSIPCMLPAT